MTDSGNKRREIYKFNASWPIYAVNWTYRSDSLFRVIIGSFLEEYTNKIQIVSLNEDVGTFQVEATVDHPYPATKVIWIPDQNDEYCSLFATTGDYLRLWQVSSNGSDAKQISLLNNNKNSDYCSPLTSFDWCEKDCRILATASIDTTVTIWDLLVEKKIGEIKENRKNISSASLKTQLIAHDNEVFDVAFARGSAASSDVFASVGADGSLRMFDQRNLQHSTIVFEEPKNTPLLRLSWNAVDDHYIATIALRSSDVFIFDIRVPSTPVARLTSHVAPVNAVCWAPHSACHIVTVGDDSLALIWDVSRVPIVNEDPILAYTASSEISGVAWNAKLRQSNSCVELVEYICFL
ncbi:hypothetical protein SNEBB_004830 [Seison nebaliae]|nr:hypothetical protein SNEBB_004830 [Seison nebaliae]